MHFSGRVGKFARGFQSVCLLGGLMLFRRRGAVRLTGFLTVRRRSKKEKNCDIGALSGKEGLS